MSVKDAYERKLEGRLEQWNAEIAKLQAEAKAASADAEISIREDIAALEDRRDRAQARLDELRAASDDAWHDLKAGIERAFDEMSEAVRKASRRFG